MDIPSLMCYYLVSLQLFSLSNKYSNTIYKADCWPSDSSCRCIASFHSFCEYPSCRCRIGHQYSSNSFACFYRIEKYEQVKFNLFLRCQWIIRQLFSVRSLSQRKSIFLTRFPCSLIAIKNNRWQNAPVLCPRHGLLFWRNQCTGSWLSAHELVAHIMMFHSDRNIGTKIQNGPAVKATLLVPVIVNIIRVVVVNWLPWPRR